MPLWYLEGKNPEDLVQRDFGYARRTLRYCFGLDLTLIELVKLRHYVEDAVRDLFLVEHRRNGFQARDEAVKRFLIFEYGLPPKFKVVDNAIMGIPYKPLNEWLKRRQEEMHFP